MSWKDESDAVNCYCCDRDSSKLAANPRWHSVQDGQKNQMQNLVFGPESNFSLDFYFHLCLHLCFYLQQIRHFGHASWDIFQLCHKKGDTDNNLGSVRLGQDGHMAVNNEWGLYCDQSHQHYSNRILFAAIRRRRRRKGKSFSLVQLWKIIAAQIVTLTLTLCYIVQRFLKYLDIHFYFWLYS